MVQFSPAGHNIRVTSNVDPWCGMIDESTPLGVGVGGGGGGGGYGENGLHITKTKGFKERPC